VVFVTGFVSEISIFGEIVTVRLAKHSAHARTSTQGLRQPGIHSRPRQPDAVLADSASWTFSFFRINFF
jgi:hypothetical protein